jgi:hypothetical protein
VLAQLIVHLAPYTARQAIWLRGGVTVLLLLLLVDGHCGSYCHTFMYHTSDINTELIFEMCPHPFERFLFM